MSDPEMSDSSEEEDVGAKRKKPLKPKKSKKRRLHQFLDMEAAVGTDDDEEEDEEEFDDFAGEAEEAMLAERELDTATRRRLDERADVERPVGGMKGVTDVIPNLEQKAAAAEYDAESDDGIGEMQIPDLLGDAVNSRVWMVRVKRGMEKTLCISLLTKFASLKSGTTPLGVRSVYVNDEIKGYMYVEAEKQEQVTEALNGLYGAYLWGQRGLSIVPMRDVPSLFSVGKKALPMPHVGDILRIRKLGIYANDLCQVESVEDHAGSVIVKILPRLDFNDLIMKDREQCPAEPLSMYKTTKTRLAPRRFDRDEVMNQGGSIQTGPTRETYKFRNYVFTEDGYLQRKVSINALLLGNDVKATPSELKTFHGTHVAPTTTEDVGINTGDHVVVIEDEMKGIRGTVVRVSDEYVTVAPAAGQDLTENLDFARSAVAKEFQPGQKVYVASGPKAGLTGLISSVDYNERTAVVLATSTHKSHVVSLECLSMGGEGNRRESYGYVAGDLVLATNQEVGVVYRIDDDGTVKIVKTDGGVSTLDSTSIASRLNTMTNKANDTKGIGFDSKAAVHFVEGPWKDATVKILHIWKDHVFLMVPNESANGGIMAVKATDLRVATTRIAPGGARPMGPSREMIQLVGRRVKIRTGRLKGQMADVKRVHGDLLVVLPLTGGREVKFKMSDVTAF